MPKINSRTKGASGEREFCDYLYENFQIDQKPERNLEQVRSGGADIICPPFAFEIKRCEVVKHSEWWAQVKEAVSNPKGPAYGLIPVVAYRQNKKNWEFLISASHIGVGFGFLHITEFVFKDWLKFKLEQYEKEKNKILVPDFGQNLPELSGEEFKRQLLENIQESIRIVGD